MPTHTQNPIRAAFQKQNANPMAKPDMSPHDQEINKVSASFAVGQDVNATQDVEGSLQNGNEGELSIPVEHAMAAQRLLMWPSIKALLYPKEYDEDYVMKLEESRGLIRVYGRGEGDESSEGTQQGQTYIYSASAQSLSNADKEPPRASSPSDSPWDSTRMPVTPAISIKTVEHGIEQSGLFTTHPDIVRRLHLNYMEHFHKLHPFLDQDDLERKIEMFISVYCFSERSSSVFDPPMNNHNNRDHSRGAKRKLSCIQCDHPPRIEQSIDNAVILLVLALGSISECRDRPVPGPVGDTPGLLDSMNQRVLWLFGSNSAMPTSGSFFASSHSPKSPSVVELQSRSGPMKHSRKPPNIWNLQNTDVIPGLAYYGYATRILGNLMGANGLQHVQASLLASLYAGQLAHPFQSYGWIYQAARTCQVLVRSYGP